MKRLITVVCLLIIFHGCRAVWMTFERTRQAIKDADNWEHTRFLYYDKDGRFVFATCVSDSKPIIWPARADGICYAEDMPKEQP